jgi:hypothetical protein
MVCEAFHKRRRGPGGDRNGLRSQAGCRNLATFGSDRSLAGAAGVN